MLSLATNFRWIFDWLDWSFLWVFLLLPVLDVLASYSFFFTFWSSLNWCYSIFQQQFFLLFRKHFMKWKLLTLQKKDIGKSGRKGKKCRIEVRSMLKGEKRMWLWLDAGSMSNQSSPENIRKTTKEKGLKWCTLFMRIEAFARFQAYNEIFYIFLINTYLFRIKLNT